MKSQQLVDLTKIRILHVIPGEEGGSSMVFSKRDVEQIELAGLGTKTFFLKTRTRPVLRSVSGFDSGRS